MIMMQLLWALVCKSGKGKEYIIKNSEVKELIARMKQAVGKREAGEGGKRGEQAIVHLFLERLEEIMEQFGEFKRDLEFIKSNYKYRSMPVLVVDSYDPNSYVKYLTERNLDAMEKRVERKKIKYSRVMEQKAAIEKVFESYNTQNYFEKLEALDSFFERDTGVIKHFIAASRRCIAKNLNIPVDGFILKELY